MAKLDNQAIVALLAAKGLNIPADNPNLIQVAKSLGVLPETLHGAKVIGYKDKAEVPVGTEGAKHYVAVSGGARGRDCWFPVKGEDPLATVRSIRDACSELLGE